MLRHRTLLAVSAALALLCACASVGPDYHPPALNLPASWLNPARTSPNPALTAWWQSFNDPALDALIAAAQSANPDLRTAAARLREVRANREASASARLPSVDASLSAKRTRLGNEVGSGLINNQRAGIDASWEVDLWGGIRRSIQASDADLAASAADLQSVRVSLAAETALDYFTLRALETRRVATAARLQAQEATLELTRLRYRAGITDSLELARAESSTAQTRAQLPALDQSLARTRNQLCLLLGRAPGAIAELAQGRGELPQVDEALAVSIPADALRQRPDLAAAEQRLIAQTARVGVAEADRYPSLAISGSIGVDSLTVGRMFDPAFWVSNAAASLAAPLFDGGRRSAAVDAAEARREQALIAYEASVRTALAEVEDALNAWQNEGLRLAQLREADRTAQEAARLAELSYRVGKFDYLTLLDAQRSALSTLDQRISAELDRNTALVQLYKAMGGGWPAPAPLKDGTPQP